MDKWQKWLDRFNSIPTWIKASAGFITGLVSFILLARNNFHLVVVVSGFALFIFILGGSIYILYSKTPPLIEGGRGVYRFPSFRPYAIVGIIIFVLMIFSIILIQPIRKFIYYGFVGTPTATSTPTPIETPTEVVMEFYFSPESPGEPLIIVVPFNDEDNLGKSPEKRIERNLLEKVDEMQDYQNKPRVEIYPETVDTQNEARSIGQKYKATIVVWGWYDELGIQSYAEIIKSTPIKRAVGKELPNIPNPNQLLFCLKDGAPNQATYLSLFALGLASYYVADFDQAINFFGLASEISVSEDCPSEVNEGLLFRGKSNLLAGNFDQAEEDILTYLEMVPDSIDGHLIMGFLQLSGCWTGLPVGNNWEAEEEANFVLNLDDKNAEAYYLRGLYYFCELSGYQGEQLEQYKEKAINDFSQTINLNPDTPDGYLNLALLQQDISVLAEGIDKYEQKIVKEPNNCFMYSQIGSILSTYNIMDALEEERCSYEIFLYPSWGISSECDLLKLMEDIDFSKSFSNFNKSIELCPYSPYFYLERGILYGWVGECILAAKDFDQAEILEPHSGSDEIIQAFRDWNESSCIQK